ncbi:MAG: hypothetical protein GYB67_18990 [Chloroflexi bacterium]|nr:hypothetical protein [Chloroflexota bacterium]
MPKNQFLLRALLVVGALLIGACSVVGGPGADLVPTTGDTAADASAAQQYLPNLAGYTASSVSSVGDAIAAAGGAAALVTGNVALTAMIAQIDGMIDCYGDVGAVAARVYTQVNIGQLLQGQIPSVGAVAVLNQDRLVNNFFACAVGSNARASGVEPCAGNGTLTAPNGETIYYLYAGSDAQFCAAALQSFQGR